MRKIVLSMHISLDGFVAGPNGEMDWIHVDEELFDFVSKLTDRAETALYGRVTYEMMESYWPTAAVQPNASKHDVHHSNWYNSVTKIVVSNTMKSNNDNVQIVGDNLEMQIQHLKQKASEDIIIFGSPTAVHSLMKFNLIDEFWLFVNPVLLGEGIPLFKNINNKVNLKLAETKTFSSGIIAMHYDKLRIIQNQFKDSKSLYHLLDIFFMILHPCIIIFNLFGWVWKKTRKANLALLVLTGASWFILGIFKGIGYCPFTDWHWQVLRKLGQYNLPNSYIKYLVLRITGLNLNDQLVDIITVVAFAIALACSLYFNFRKSKSST